MFVESGWGGLWLIQLSLTCLSAVPAPPLSKSSKPLHTGVKRAQTGVDDNKSKRVRSFRSRAKLFSESDKNIHLQDPGNGASENSVQRSEKAASLKSHDSTLVTLRLHPVHFISVYTHDAFVPYFWKQVYTSMNISSFVLTHIFTHTSLIMAHKSPTEKHRIQD